MRCPECIPCDDCSGVVLCLDDSRAVWPCPHFERICGECWPGTCEPCIAVAEREAVDAC